jgi:hypothetical protein
MARVGVKVLKPKGQFDRTLQRVAQQRMWEMVPACIDYLKSVIENGEEKTRDRIRAAQLLLERTIPTVERVDVRALMLEAGLLGDNAGAGSDELEAQKSRAALRLVECAELAWRKHNGEAH